MTSMASMGSPTTLLIFLGSLSLRLISKKGGLGLSLILGSFIAGLSIGVLLVFFLLTDVDHLGTWYQCL